MTTLWPPRITSPPGPVSGIRGIHSVVVVRVQTDVMLGCRHMNNVRVVRLRGRPNQGRHHAGLRRGATGTLGHTAGQE